MALRQQDLGRVAALAGLLSPGLLLPRAASAEGRVFAVAVADELRDPAARRELEPLLGSLGYRQVSWMGIPELEARVSLVSVVDMRADEACGGAIGLADWSERLQGAQEAVQLLDSRGALASLAALGLDIACLDWVPRQQDLVLFALTTAEAHALAAADAANIGQRLFHEGEQTVALSMAASFGPDLPPPSWLSPALRQGLLDAQTTGGLRGGAPALFGGTAKGLWLDGQHITSGFRRLSPGPHLLQATWDQQVVAARVLQVGADQRLLVEVNPGERQRQPDDLVEELRSLTPQMGSDPIVLDLVSLLAEEADDAVIVGLGQGEPVVWGRERGKLVLLDPGERQERPGVSFEDLGEEPAPRERPPRPPPIPWTLGFGPGLLVGGYGEGDLEGMDGLMGGAGLDLRVSFARSFAAAVTFQPVARAEALPPGYDAHWLWRAAIPLRLGVRYGAPIPRPSLEVGPDLALMYFGRFGDRVELRPLGALSLGFHLPLAPSFGLRIEGWGGVGAGTWVSGLRLAALAHPAAELED